MKIAFFHELHLGGARRAANEFGKGLKKNHIVDLYIVGESLPDEEKKFYTDVFFYKFVAKKWLGKNWKVRLYKDTIELYHLYKLHKKIADTINSKKYDVIFIHPSQYTQAPFILRFLKSKKIYYCQEPLRMVYEDDFSLPQLGMMKNSYEYITRSIKKRIDRDNIIHADIILSNSVHSRNTIKKAYGLENIVCYLGVDSLRFKPTKTKKKYDVLFMGSLEQIDGFSLLEESLHIMKKKPHIKKHISGKEWVVDDEDFVRLYTQSKITVCLAKNEPFGLIPLESMACGIPVIAINDGGYKETVINGVTGFLIPPKPQLLAEKIELLLKNQTLQEKMGKNGRNHVVKHWNWEKSVKEIERIMIQSQLNNLA